MRSVKQTVSLGFAVVGLVAAGLLTSSPASAKASKPAARISAAQAQAAAVKKIPGKVVSSKYEFEDGRWQYAVLVQKGKSLYEVEVAATSGKVLDTEKTTMAEEAAEARADKAAANKTTARHKKPAK